MLERVIAIVLILSLAGCARGADARIVPVDDALDGMAVDVVRVDVSPGFTAAVVAPDGAIFGTRLVSHGPFRDYTFELVVVELDGEVTVIDEGVISPWSAAISETSVAWVTSDIEYDAAGQYSTGSHRIFTSSRSNPEPRELTELVFTGAGTPGDHEPELHLLGDTVFGAIPHDESITVYTVTPDNKVSFLEVPNAWDMGGVDGCAADGEAALVNWQREFEGDTLPMAVHRTAVDTAGNAVTKSIDLNERSTSRGRTLSIAACADTYWYQTKFGDELALVGVDPDNVPAAALIAQPSWATHAASMTTNGDYVVGVAVGTGEFLTQVSTGRTAEVPVGGLCVVAEISGDYVMWAEPVNDDASWDEWSAWECATYVGRLAPVEG